MISIKQGEDTKEHVAEVRAAIENMGRIPRVLHGETQTVIAVIGDESNLKDFYEYMNALSFVERAEPVQENIGYKLVYRPHYPEYRDTLQSFSFRIKDVHVGNSHPIIIAGPCAIQSKKQLEDIAHAVSDAGAHMLRGGAYKPRSSPYSFQGMGEKGLELLANAGERTNLPTVTEITRPDLVDTVGSYVDVFQIGARNMSNFELLKEIGKYAEKHDKGIILKTGTDCPSLSDVLASAEYLVSQGANKVMLCERGISLGKAPGMRNHPRPDFLYALREHTPLPVLGDPSHAIGRRDLVPMVGNNYLNAGAHGLLIEVWAEHLGPKIAGESVCDAGQSLNFKQFKDYMKTLQ